MIGISRGVERGTKRIIGSWQATRCSSVFRSIGGSLADFGFLGDDVAGKDGLVSKKEFIRRVVREAGLQRGNLVGVQGRRRTDVRVAQ